MSEGGWLVDLILPSTDRIVAQQAVVVGLVFLALLLRACRADLIQSWVGSLISTHSLLLPRGPPRTDVAGSRLTVVQPQVPVDQCCCVHGWCRTRRA